MGQIVGGAAKPKRCNINQLSQLGTPAAGEHILVSSDNSMNAAGQGNFDCYIVGEGTKAATVLELKNIDADKDLRNYIFGAGGVDESYDINDCTSGIILKNNGTTRSFSGYKTSDFIAIPNGTRFLYTSGLLKNDANTYIGLKFYTTNSASGVISDNVAASGEAIPATIELSDWPTAKYLRFCMSGTAGTIRLYTEAGSSELISDLLVQETGQSGVVAMSQKATTNALSLLETEIDGITSDGVDTTFDDSNSNTSSGLLRVSGGIYSSSSYKTSAMLDIPTGTQFLETSSLYKNDTNTFIGLLLYDNNGNIITPYVAASGESIPATIDLSDYPTAAKLRWSSNASASPYVRCYSVSAIKTAVLGMIDDQLGDDNEKLMSQKGISEALANMAEEIKGAEYVSLQSDALTADSGNWTFGNSWTFSANGATPPATGAENYMRNTLIYYSDRRFMRVRVTMGSDTKLILTCSYGNSLNAGEGASAFGIDFTNKHIIIYGNTGYGGVSNDSEPTNTGYDLSKTVESATIPDAMIGAREYVVELYKHGTLHQLKLMDTKTGAAISVAHDGWAAGRQNQLYGFYCESGTLPTLKEFGVYSQKNPDIVFAGDSITEGVYVNDRQYTYPNRYRKDMPSKRVVVSARGGQDISGLMPLFTSEWNIVRPKAISLLIGANGGNTSARLQAFKDACDNIGATLILHYCSCRTGRSMADNNNTLIPAMNLEGARFDWATAVDNTPNSDYSNINSSLFADSTHPNISGQAEMYKRLQIDCPSMYR